MFIIYCLSPFFNFTFSINLLMQISTDYTIFHFPSLTECSNSGLVFKILGCGNGDRAAPQQLKPPPGVRIPNSLHHSISSSPAPFHHRLLLCRRNPVPHSSLSLLLQQVCLPQTTIANMHTNLLPVSPPLIFSATDSKCISL